MKRYNTNALRQDLRRIGLKGLAEGIAGHMRCLGNKRRDGGDMAPTIKHLNKTIENAFREIESLGGSRENYLT